MNANLEKLINELKNSNQNHFIDYFDNYLKKLDYTPEESPNTLKDKYEEIIEYYRDKSKDENKSDKN